MGRMFLPGLAVAAAILVVLAASGDAPVRAAADTIVVNTAGDTSNACAMTGSGVCSLRDAITFANNNDGHDTIEFGIAGEIVHTIVASSPLPALVDPAGTTIDGYSQPTAHANTLSSGSNANIVIQVDGVLAGATPGLQVNDGEVIIRGLSMTRWNGAAIRVAGGSGIVISGNILGLTPEGVVAPNVRGIDIENVSGVRVGGAPAADRNVISGNAGAGIRLSGADETAITGNLIGTGFTGDADAGNGGFGIEIGNGTVDTVVGGTHGDANTIAYNAGGVRIDDGIRNRVIANRMFLNDGPGIDLIGEGVTANDQGDLDPGPNFTQNYPVLESVFVSNVTSNVIILGVQDSDDLSGLNRIDYYIADALTDGNGEGQTWIGTNTGLPAGTIALPGTPFAPATTFTAGAMITATATTNDGTSEFAANAVAVLNQRPIAVTGDDQVAPPKKVVTLDGSGSSDGDGLPSDLAHHWEQTGGKPVTLSDATAPMPVFTPTQGGDYEFQLTVSDGLDTSLPATTTVTIIDANPPTASALTTSAVGGTPRSMRLRASDAEATEFTFKIVTPPQFGAISSMNEQNGTLIYTANTSFSGVDTFTFTAFDGANLSAPGTVTINVSSGLVVESGVLPNATLGRAYSLPIPAAGGNGVYSWKFAGGTLPPGMTVNAQGVLSGTPTEVGVYQFGVQVTDGNGLKAQRTIQLSVVEPKPRAFSLFVMLVTTN